MTSKVAASGRIVDSAVVAIMGALQFVFLVGLPWNDYGLWPQTEGPTIALHALSCLLAALVGVRVAMGDQHYITALKSPVVVVLGLFAVWSALAAPFSDVPLRSLHGTIKHGVGVLWNIEFFVVALAAAALWQKQSFRHFLVGTTTVSTLIVLLLYAFDYEALGVFESVGVPLDFPEWSGLLSLAAAGVVGLAASQSERYARGLGLLAIVIGIAGYAVSTNRAVLLAGLVIAMVWVIWKLFSLGRTLASPNMRSLTVVTAAVGLAAVIGLAAPIVENIVVPKEPMRVALSSSLIDQMPIQDTSLGTIWSRSYMVRILVSDIVSDPSTMLFGKGFGHFATSYEHHARDVPGRMFPTALVTASRAYWDAHTAANFHSHNMLMETLTSVGLVGALLWLGVFVAMARSSRAGTLVALGAIVAGSFWFPINHMMATMAIVTAAAGVSLKGREVVEPRRSKILPTFGTLLAVFGTAVFAFGAITSLALAVVERQERYFVPLEINKDIETCGFMRSRFFNESEVVIDLYRILVYRITSAENPKQELWDRTTNLHSINCMLRRYYTKGDDIRALTESLRYRGQLVSMGGPLSYGAMQRDIGSWGDDIARLLSMAPSRTEFLPPYLTLLIERSPEKASEEFDRFLAIVPPDDPVHPYIEGLKARANGDKEGLHKAMRRAFDMGFANLWSVPARAAALLMGE